MKQKINIYTPEEILGAEKVFDYLKVNDKYYDRLELVPTKEVEDKIKKSKKMANKLKDSLDAEKVLTEIFMTRFSKKEFKKLYNNMFKSKRKYKAKTREGDCVDMKFGNIIIPIVD